ncbi:MAG TPA: hypothetical protein PKD24_16200 [Pyrinomonadaceae bacterium]|nr:hypothetical protein [Pyrinomonadaceae bacterium]HMP66905.1 hypothetical protein [Pyrinomonadaceae bacterium]
MKGTREITAKQEKLIAHLLTERTIEGACRQANVAVITYWRWMKEDAFLREYRRARRGMLENTVARLQSITASAIDTLERNLYCENPSVETRTATVILEQAIKGIEVLDLEKRLETLEAVIESTEKTK